MKGDLFCAGTLPDFSGGAASGRFFSCVSKGFCDWSSALWIRSSELHYAGQPAPRDANAEEEEDGINRITTGIDESEKEDLSCAGTLSDFSERCCVLVDSLAASRRASVIGPAHFGSHLVNYTARDTGTQRINRRGKHGAEDRINRIKSKFMNQNLNLEKRKSVLRWNTII